MCLTIASHIINFKNQRNEKYLAKAQNKLNVRENILYTADLPRYHEGWSAVCDSGIS